METVSWWLTNYAYFDSSFFSIVERLHTEVVLKKDSDLWYVMFWELGNSSKQSHFKNFLDNWFCCFKSIHFCH